MNAPPRGGRMSRLTHEQLRTRTRKRRLRSAAVVLTAAAVVAVVVAVALNVPLPGVGGPRVPPGQPVQVTIPPGTPTGQIGRILEDAGVVDRGGAFSDEAVSRGVDAQLQPGTYQLTTGMDTDALFGALVGGPQAAPGNSLTIPEGLTIAQIAQRIADTGRWSLEEVQQALADPALASPYRPEGGVPQPLEGLLFPLTYPLHDDTQLPALLQGMLDQTQAVMQRQDFTTARALNLTDYDILIVASMIEREAVLPEDRPKIAQVIYNRLRAGMRLQIDATVQYALGEQRERLSIEDTRTESPHNTYVIDGLPPTPISAPGEDSIKAALAPADGPWTFYVRTEENGAHSFTDNIDEFNRLKQLARERGLI